MDDNNNINDSSTDSSSNSNTKNESRKNGFFQDLSQMAKDTFSPAKSSNGHMFPSVKSPNFFKNGKGNGRNSGKGGSGGGNARGGVGNPGSLDSRLQKAQAQYNRAKENANDPYKEKKDQGSDNGPPEFEKKNALDKVKDKINVASSGMNLASAKKDKLLADVEKARHPLQAAKVAVKEIIKEKVKKAVVSFVIKFLLPALGFALLGIGIAVLVVFLITLIAGGGDDDSSSSTTHTSSSGSMCTYQVGDKAVVNPKVRLLYCDGSGPIESEELVDFEKYVLGVVRQEIGDISLGEAVKAQAIAARTFALNRVVAMGGTGGVKLEQDGDQWILNLRSCTNDQVYCDPDKGCSSNVTGGQTSNNNPGGWKNCTVYSGVDSGRKWSRDPLPEDSDLRKWVAETTGIVVMKNNKLIEAGYLNSTQNSWISGAKSGKDAFELLVGTYGKDIVKSTTNCTAGQSNTGINGSSIDISSLKSTSEFSKIYRGSLSSFNGSGYSVDAHSQYITDSVKKAGLGTGAGVGAAGAALVNYMANYGYKLQYTYGGSSDKIGAVNGLDCSGFVSWAIHNGGFKYERRTSSGFKSLGTACRRTDTSCVGKAGDLVWRSGHIMLISAVDGDNYWISEAQCTNCGMQLRKQPMHKDGGSKEDYVIKMDSFYANSSNKVTSDGLIPSTALR